MAGSKKQPPQEPVSLAALLGPTYNPMQLEFILASEWEVCWVGGLGCGKTTAGIVCGLRHCFKYGENARFFIGLPTFRQMEGSIKQDFFDFVTRRKLEAHFTRPKEWDWREGTNFVRFANGAELVFGNMESGDKLKGFQFSGAVVDQVEMVPFNSYQMLLQRTRWPGVPGTDRHVWSIANDEGDNWVRQRFLTYEPPHGRPIKGATRKLFRGVSFDNPHLDTQARNALLALPPDVQSRYIYATMDAMTTRLLPDLRVIPAFEIPRHWPRWCGIDPARSTGVTAAEWITVNPDDKEYKGVPPNAPVFYQEYWAEGRFAEDHADAINNLCGPHPMRARTMDHSAWHTVIRARKFGSISVADLYIRAGLPVSQSQGDEWARVLLYLEAHKRGLLVFDTCKHLLRQAPEYRTKDQVHPVSGKPLITAKAKFHAVDAGGYALSVIPTKVAPVDVRELRPGFDIGENVDDGSRRHWESELRRTPMRRGNESVVTAGFDEREFFQDEIDYAPVGGDEDDLY